MRSSRLAKPQTSALAGLAHASGQKVKRPQLKVESRGAKVTNKVRWWARERLSSGRDGTRGGSRSRRRSATHDSLVPARVNICTSHILGAWGERRARGDRCPCASPPSASRLPPFSPPHGGMAAARTKPRPSVTLSPHAAGRHEEDGEGADEHRPATQVENPVARRVQRQHVRRNDGRHDPEDAAPETGQPARRSTNGSGEHLGRPAVQDGIEHGLEEVFHHVEADVRRFRIHSGKEEERRGHKGRRHDHSPLSPDDRDGVHERTQQHADDTGRVDDDVVAIRFCLGDTDLMALGEQNLGEEGPWTEELVTRAGGTGEGRVPATEKPQ